MDITGIASTRPSAPSPGIDLVRSAASQAATAATLAVTNSGISSAATATGKSAAPSESDVKRSVEEINSYLKPASNGIQFSQDEDTGKTLVKIVDTSTGTVIRQIPTQQLVEISKDLSKLQGLLVKDRA